MKNTLITLFVAALMIMSCCRTQQAPPIVYDSDVNYLNLNCRQTNIKQTIHADLIHDFTIKCKINTIRTSYIEEPIFILDQGIEGEERYYFSQDVEYQKGRISGIDQPGSKIDHTLIFYIEPIPHDSISPKIVSSPKSPFETTYPDKFKIEEGDAIDIFIVSKNDRRIDTRTRILCSDKEGVICDKIIDNDDYICRSILLNTQ